MTQMGLASGNRVTTTCIPMVTTLAYLPFRVVCVPTSVPGTRGRLARRRVSHGVAVRAVADPSLLGRLPRHVHRRVDARPPAPQGRGPLARAAVRPQLEREPVLVHGLSRR